MDKNIIKLTLKNIISYHIRSFCYKTVKRPNINLLNTKTSSKLDSVPKDASKSIETPDLMTHLKQKMLLTGPITVAQYMKEVLTHPVQGYYMNRDVFGAQGDFITSPEIGQIFGELIAVWCLFEWQKVGSPNPFQLIELGPGRGTLSRDILRVFSQFRVEDQFTLNLVEISPHLSQIQAQKLCFDHKEIDLTSNKVNNKIKISNQPQHYREGQTASGTKVFWYHKLEDVPKEKFSIVVAHEFFDALPIHKLQRDVNNKWKEVLIDIDRNQENKFRMVLSKSQTPISKLYEAKNFNDKRDCLEYSVETEKIIEELVNRFEHDGGFGLIVDYGHFGEKTDTFRAFRRHKLCDPLIDPGTADLTADVDYKLIKLIAERNHKAITFGPIEQRNFLKNMEGETRLEILLKNCLPEKKEQIKSGYEMLTDPKKMGSRFKFFSIFPAVLKEHLKKFPVSGFNKKS